MEAQKRSGGIKKIRRCKHCTNKATSRGVCDTCRKDINARITRGEFTDDEAISLGYIDRKKKVGRPARSGFARKLAKAKQ